MTKNDNKKLKEIIDLACEEAKRLGNTKVSPEHLFLGMLRMDQARAIDVLIALGVDFYEVKAKIEQKLNKQRDKSEEMPDELDLTLAANSIVKRVIEEAWKLGDEEVESEHLMLAMLRNQAGFVTKLFNSMGVDYEKFKEQLLKEKPVCNPIMEKNPMKTRMQVTKNRCTIPIVRTGLLNRIPRYWIISV